MTGLSVDGMLDDSGDFRVLKLSPSERKGKRLLATAAAATAVCLTSRSFWKCSLIFSGTDVLLGTQCFHLPRLPTVQRKRRPLPSSSSLRRSVRVGFTADVKLPAFDVAVVDSSVLLPDPYRWAGPIRLSGGTAFSWD